MLSTGFLLNAKFFACILVSIQVYSVSSFAPQRCSNAIPRRSFARRRIFEMHLKIDDSSEDPRQLEFDLSDLPQPTDIRKQRFLREEENRERYAQYGNDLWELRNLLKDLSKKLIDSIAIGADNVKEVRQEIWETEQKDANIVYGLELDAMDKALEEEREDDAREHRNNARNARDQLIYFNYEGLWVGKYGDYGFELVNITYTGDTLIARKVTDDSTVPAGEITFQADLAPPRHSKSLSKSLPNIKLSETASKRWGTTELKRFEGLGQVAEEGFVKSQWLEGQMVLINEENFSFAWLPINYQIFFGRPSPELQLKMLEEAEKKKVDVMNNIMQQGIDTLSFENADVEKDYVVKCFDATRNAIEDGLIDDYSESCIFVEEDACCFE
uniref:Uncharacterized protein n=1 Tax=Chaetoceros debilis TaxID=122233 RepID=A0A7S3Q5B1_9STRA|mmetsp:Transcript_7961/g.11353  ORF Transcript_7961/g.11353 Transcript_7961/m.11353 type:complete len:385 (-) Transcript_7961:480-1634(-)